VNSGKSQFSGHGISRPAVCLLLLCLLLPRAHAQLGLPPIITVPPLDQTVQNGGSATFSVLVTSLTRLSYQWRFNGVNIPGATGNAYTRTNVHYIDEGLYSVAVTNSAGWAVSSGARLSIINPPLQFVGYRVETNGFQAQLVGPVGGKYVVLASTNLKDWLPISTNLAPNGTLNFIDSKASNYSRRFYRAQLQ